MSIIASNSALVSPRDIVTLTVLFFTVHSLFVKSYENMSIKKYAPTAAETTIFSSLCPVIAYTQPPNAKETI